MANKKKDKVFTLLGFLLIISAVFLFFSYSNNATAFMVPCLAGLFLLAIALFRGEIKLFGD